MAKPSSSASFSSYVNYTMGLGILTAEEEKELAVAIFDRNDKEAVQKLVTSHLGFVNAIARKFVGYNLPLEDLVQEGAIGLIRAAEKFNPNMNVRFASYAAHWIKASIFDYAVKNHSVVRVATSKAQRKLFFKLRSQQKDGAWFSAGEVANISEELDVKECEVREMELRLSGQPVSFDSTAANDDDNFAPSLQETLAEENDSIQQYEEYEYAVYQETVLRSALATLNDRERIVIQQRWLSDSEDKLMLRDIADMFGVSVERARQIEADAIKKLRKKVLLLDNTLTR